jgi:transposase
MGTQQVFESLPTLGVEWIAFTAESVQIGLISQAKSCICPSCSTSSSHVHGYYTRRLHDSPAHGRVVELLLNLRRFVCRRADCQQQTFDEQVPELMQTHARMSSRLAAELRETALLLGGEAGKRLACKLHMPVSADTLLRLIRRTPQQSSIIAPRVLGVDDWAFRRGRCYGTILCDLESHQVIDLLPDRSAEALASWLKAHPGAEVISRDRSGEYARGAALGAPQAKQVADRFHLVRNLIEAFERGLDRQRALFDEAAKASSLNLNCLPQHFEVAGENTAAAAAPPIDSPVSDGAKPKTKRQRRYEQSRSRRMALYQQVKELMAIGLSLRAIGRRLHLSHHTVLRYAHAQQFPEPASHPLAPTPLDRFVPHLKQRWEQGVCEATQLFAELVQQGFCGSIHMVRRQLTALREAEKADKKSTRHWRPSIKHAAWLLLYGDAANSSTTPSELLRKQQAFVAALHQKRPELAPNVWMIQEFSRVLSQDDPAELEAWVALSDDPQVMREIKQFAKNLRNDWAAVVEAVRQPWSNGQVEGQVNRLKTIKRQMYGRAEFDLLRARVLQMN